MTLVNTQCRLAARPVSLPKATDWTFTEEPVQSPADGELLVRVQYLSIDPAMRTAFLQVDDVSLLVVTAKP